MPRYQCTRCFKPFRSQNGLQFHLSWAHPERIVIELADDEHYAQLRLTLAGLREMASQGSLEAAGKVPEVQRELYRYETLVGAIADPPTECVQCGTPQANDMGLCEKHQKRQQVAPSHSPDAQERAHIQARRDAMRELRMRQQPMKAVAS